MRPIVTLVVAVVLLLAGAPTARATTWGPTEESCPLCGHANTFEAPMSWGSYVYRWPSRFQLVFWPATEERSLYSCAQCRLTCFMWDWKERVAPEHHERLRAALADVTLPAPEGGYRKIPVLERLTVAEKVYDVLGIEPAERCRFYRVLGYHAAKQGQPDRAAAARRQALELVRALIADDSAAAERKEQHVIAACLLRLLGEPDAARAELDAAAPLSIQGDDAERARGRTEYLDDLIGALRQRLDASDLSDDAPERRAGETEGR